ncbi:MAG TPA: bifunctional diaminohydroxyphosphoribosylaminopyrimidine deaminase/5-amino-6-(5-phosphoribosylamino)uracil reductase RibD, partial [Rhizobiales bacterium]|nr:bifunctional diaminohydroxyphosphoribosylaminopyrimidine deaminase/5-amino-6-(5-phosphoribosylamino)uracil reductase RibD [Hyphomicrobiales bacterium]
MSVAGYKDEDHRYMSMALALGRRGLGTTMPNPAVGAVIVQGAGEHAEVIGRGWTQPGGRPHAETEALGRAGERARGATLYVTLEPCSHHGRTSPCAEAIIKAGIRRVVIAIRDPDERVAGQGIALLEAAGIAVVEGIGREEARWLTLGHIRRV